MSDLFKAFATGSEEAFEVYYKRYHRPIYRGLKKLCHGNEALAQDLTQETFLNCWKRRQEFTGEAHLRNNLFLMARAYFLMHLRQRRKVDAAEKEVFEWMAAAGESAELVLTTEEVLVIIEAKMEQLPPQQKMVVELLNRGLDIGAVAQRLQLAPQTVYNHKARAIRFLQGELNGRDLSLVSLLVAVVCWCFAG